MIIIGIRNRVLICMLISCKVSQSFVLSSQKGEDDDLYSTTKSYSTSIATSSCVWYRSMFHALGQCYDHTMCWAARSTSRSIVRKPNAHPFVQSCRLSYLTAQRLAWVSSRNCGPREQYHKTMWIFMFLSKTLWIIYVECYITATDL